MKISSQKIRFVVVGGLNTLIDFGIFTILIKLSIDPIFANYASTTVAVFFSFIANKNYTFRSKGPTRKKEIVTFLAVTLVGLWALQPLVIRLLVDPIATVVDSYFAASLFAKVCATVVSLVWNYILYEKVVFDKHKDE